MLSKPSFGSRFPPEQTRQQRVVEYKKIIHFSFFLEVAWKRERERRERAKNTKNDRVLIKGTLCLFLENVEV